MQRGSLKEYLTEPFLKTLYDEVRKAGAIRSISLDLTHECNIHCKGCYYFSQQINRLGSNATDGDFDRLIESEKERGTNFVTVVGGEPSLELGRLKKVYDNFKMNVSTNGFRKIPYEGFEQMPIGVSVWGNHATDRKMRGSGKRDIFPVALKNYRNDSRAFWYYTVTPGNAHEIQQVTEECVRNGNRVLYTFYSDLTNMGGSYDHRQGFQFAREEIARMIERFPEHILLSNYIGEVVSTGKLFEQEWGYSVCTSISTNNPVNAERLTNGNPYSPHFRAYNADFLTTRRCCTATTRSCDSCLDVWQHFSWIILNMKKHLTTEADFTNWLTTMYLFYFINRLVDWEKGAALLPEIHRRIGMERFTAEARKAS
ncbi:radical SAM domain protein [Chloroherpeton thalassium ATCC 35110]|uniref:Radical SAM domain protein n=1 Tax=Chloroherpeton thalassium (strain ATCC 35110 / GB-78) TaxID=517418 RepID=B3QSV2_CHLT3|nr:radical SAM protein [Chloroherpeton thalassium]ACF12595.1 radical SAM domain protein [Chloroherpeton thalassium ATCC 35110]